MQAVVNQIGTSLPKVELRPKTARWAVRTLLRPATGGLLAAQDMKPLAHFVVVGLLFGAATALVFPNHFNVPQSQIILRRGLIRKEETQVVPSQRKKFAHLVNSARPREKSCSSCEYKYQEEIFMSLSSTDKGMLTALR